MCIMHPCSAAGYDNLLHAHDQATMRTPAQGFTRRQLRVGFVAIRTLWFDRQLRDATTLERHPAPYRLSLTAADGVIRVSGPTHTCQTMTTGDD
jgi:hypothetical protein